MNLGATVGWRIPHGGDPCYLETLFLMQNGVMVDKSPYARELTDAGGVTTMVSAPAFPGGLGVRVNAAHNVGGIVWTGSQNAPELAALNGAVCFEGFINIAPGALVLGGQLLYNDRFAFNGLVVVIGNFDSAGNGRLGFRFNGDGASYLAPVDVTPFIQEGVDTFFAGVLHPDNSIEFWAGAVSSGVATGGYSPLGPYYVWDIARPLIPPGTDPAVGFAGGSGGVNNYVLGPYRISTCDRYSGLSEIPIPTQLFLEY